MSDHIYKKVELTGSSTVDMESAIHNAVAKANQTIKNMDWFEVVDTRGHLQDGKVAHWQVTIKIGFRLE